MFHFLELFCLSPRTCHLLDLYYKALLFFFKIFKISEKVKKNKKKQKAVEENMLSLEAVKSCCLLKEHCISHPLVGLQFDLGAVLVYLSLSPPTG